MHSQRETATILAALIYWCEELCPHGPRIMRPYYKSAGFPRARPLSAAEIERLSERLRANIQ